MREEVGRALAAAGPVLTEAEAKALLARYGVPRPAEALVTSAEEAAVAAAEIGGPVALKVQSPDITHKTEAGAVALGVVGEAARSRGLSTGAGSCQSGASRGRYRWRFGPGDGAAGP